MPLALAAQHAGATGEMARFWWLVMSRVLLQIGEMCLYPVGLSAVTQLSVRHVASLMMGTWFLATACETLAALLGELRRAGCSGRHGRRLRRSRREYAHLFWLFTGLGAGCALIAFAAAPVLRRMMQWLKLVKKTDAWAPFSVCVCHFAAADSLNRRRWWLAAEICARGIQADACRTSAMCLERRSRGLRSGNYSVSTGTPGLPQRPLHLPAVRDRRALILAACGEEYGDFDPPRHRIRRVAPRAACANQSSGQRLPDLRRCTSPCVASVARSYTPT